jgi:hypothetical protein
MSTQNLSGKTSQGTGTESSRPVQSPTQAEIDAAHAQTGWSAHDVWRTRILAPKSKAPSRDEG